MDLGLSRPNSWDTLLGRSVGVVLVAAFALAVVVMGCAVRMATKPWEFEGVLLYSRITDCPKEQVPNPLPPQISPEERAAVLAAPCHTLEVGAKSYADALTAIFTGFAAILPFIV